MAYICIINSAYSGIGRGACPKNDNPAISIIIFPISRTAVTIIISAILGIICFINILMVSQGRSFMQTAPWVVIAPGLAIFITVLVFNMLGDTLSDITGRQ